MYVKTGNGSTDRIPIKHNWTQPLTVRDAQLFFNFI